jgi:hypothetical protein
MREVLHNISVENFEEWQRDAIDGLQAQAMRRHKLLDELRSKHTDSPITAVSVSCEAELPCTTGLRCAHVVLGFYLDRLRRGRERWAECPRTDEQSPGQLPLTSPSLLTNAFVFKKGNGGKRRSVHHLPRHEPAAHPIRLRVPR